MTERITINHDQGLYVIHHNEYISCLGFDVALRWGTAIAKWCGCEPPDPDLSGTEAGYADYQRINQAGVEHYRATGERCLVELEPQLTGLEGRRVEVTDTYGDTRRFWVGRSGGWRPCHIEVHNTRSRGGPAAMGPYASVRVVR